MNFRESLYIDKTIVKNTGFNPYYRQVETGLGKRMIIEGQSFISLGSNDYLGIANSEELKSAAKEALNKYGISMCSTSIVTGYTKLTKDLEDKTAEFLKQEEALIFPSGYQANLSIFQLLTNKEDAIIADRYAHASLIQGTQLSRANLFRFPHNDMKKLEKFLSNSQNCRMRFIVVDGLYSTEGDIALLDKIVELAKKYKAFTVVDDAHGIGVLGNTGRGSFEMFNVLGKIDLISGSFGKAFGCTGGFIATNHKVADFFRYRCGPLIYSTALPPVLIASIIVAIDLIEKSTERRKMLVQNKETLYTALKGMGYPLTNSITPLFSIISKEAQKIIELARDLYKKGIYATPFIPPSVPEGHSCLRCIPHANLEKEDINYIINTFTELKNIYI
ncbi:MAG: aminotransferase class I/II-fold pyridoxal phosphate-dependent enzyme [bacterium]